MPYTRVTAGHTFYSRVPTVDVGGRDRFTYSPGAALRNADIKKPSLRSRPPRVKKKGRPGGAAGGGGGGGLGKKAHAGRTA